MVIAEGFSLMTLGITVEGEGGSGPSCAKGLGCYFKSKTLNCAQKIIGSQCKLWSSGVVCFLQPAHLRR